MSLSSDNSGIDLPGKTRDLHTASLLLRPICIDDTPAMLEFTFTDLDLHRREADADDANIGSISLLEKLGFQKEGLFCDRWYVSDEWQDSVMLGLLKREWRRG